MALFNFISKRFVGLGALLPKTFVPYQSANCGTDAKDSTHSHSHLSDDCEDDTLDPNMENPFQKEKKLCILCKMNVTPNYKNTKLLSQFVSMYTGKIYGRHITGLCKKKQEQVEKEITKAQSSALMPYYLKDPAFMQDPQLFNPETPFRNHPF